MGSGVSRGHRYLVGRHEGVAAGDSLSVYLQVDEAAYVHPDDAFALVRHGDFLRGIRLLFARVDARLTQRRVVQYFGLLVEAFGFL